MPPNLIVSDGALLFWTVAGPGLYAMPVGGGLITTLSTEQMVSSTWATFLAVDSVNVYVLEGNSLVRIPKNGSPATLVNEVGATVQCATSLGGTAYWFEGEEGPDDASVARSGPLLGTVIDTLGGFPPGSPNQFAVTSSTGFVGFTGSLFSFPISGIPVSGPTAIGTTCSFVASDSNGVYCAETSGSNLIIASDGSTSSLGPAVNSAFMVSDDTYVYWVDATTVGTIMKAPKTGGGAATVLAYDTSPTAIAVDANSVYWSDQGGFIKRIPK